MSEQQTSAAIAGAVCLPLAACAALCEVLPLAADLDSALQIVEGVRQELLGDGLLTVNLLIARVAPVAPVAQGSDGQIVLQRAWSSNPAAYPPGGRKHKTITPWSRQLLLDGQVYVGQGDADLTQAFDDHALIIGLGLHSVVNVPLRDTAQRCFATFNVLGPHSAWRADEVMLVRLLATLATPAIALAARGMLLAQRTPNSLS